MNKCECGCGEVTSIARQTITRLGIVKGQHLKFIHGHHNRTKTWTNYDAFEDMKALGHYLLGVWLGDGCVYSHTNKYKYVAIASVDEEWITSIQEEVFPASKVGIQRKAKKIGKRKWKTLYRLRKADERLAAWLIAHGCTERKSLTVEMPKIRKLYAADFIRGLIDSDGSITYGYRQGNRYGCIQITTGSKKFAEAIRDLLLYCRFPAGISNRKVKNKMHYAVLINQKEKVSTMCRWLYYKTSDALHVCLKRKQKKAEGLIAFLK